MTLMQGIDVSRYQPTVDWAKVKAAGIAFAVIKASQSNFVDPLFSKHWANAKAAGMPRGAYHFLVSETDGQKQATTYLKALEADPGELVPVLDIEARTSSPATLAKYAKDWLDQVEAALGRKPIIYTAAWYWNSGMLINGQFPAWAPNYPLWVAAYPLADGFPAVSDIEAGKFKPNMPKSWATWTFWQYSEKGRVDGVVTDGRPANVDLNVFNGSAQELQAFLSAAPAAAPTPSANGNGQTPTPAAPAGTPAANIRAATNIQVINAFVRAFNNQGGSLLQSTGLLSSLTAQPVSKYTGPEIANLSGLTDAQKTALNAALTQIMAQA